MLVTGAGKMSGDNSDKKCLIFDFDGLILDTETSEVQIWRELYTQAGLTFDLKAHLKVIGSDIPHAIHPAQPLANREGETRTFEQIRRDFHQTAYNRAEKLAAMEGVAELINRAKANGYLIAVGSSSAFNWVHTHLTRLGLIDRLDTLVTLENVEKAKPAPDIFLKVLENLGVPAKNALIFEDSENGVLAAHRAGIRVIAIPNSTTLHMDFSLATAVLPSLAQFDPDLYFL